MSLCRKKESSSSFYVITDNIFLHSGGGYTKAIDDDTGEMLPPSIEDTSRDSTELFIRPRVIRLSFVYPSLVVTKDLSDT